MTYSCRGVAWSLCNASPQVDDVHLLRKAGRSPARTAWQRREALQRGLDRVSNPDGQQFTRAAEQRTYGDGRLAHESTLEKSNSVGMKGVTSRMSGGSISSQFVGVGLSHFIKRQSHIFLLRLTQFLSCLELWFTLMKEKAFLYGI